MLPKAGLFPDFQMILLKKPIGSEEKEKAPVVEFGGYFSLPKQMKYYKMMKGKKLFQLIKGGFSHASNI